MTVEQPPSSADALDLRVRFARDTESQLVSSILIEAATWVAARGAPLWPLEHLAVDAVAADVAAGRFILASAGGVEVATARLTRDDPECWPDAAPGVALYVHRVAVRRARAGCGVPRVLLAWCGNHARSLGCRYLRLDCDARRPKLRRLYEGLGFRLHSERRVGAFTIARYERDAMALDPR